MSKNVFGLLHFSDMVRHQKCQKNLFGLLALSEVCPETLRAPNDPRCRCPGAIWGPRWGGRGADRASHPVHMSNVIQVPTSLLPRSRAPHFSLSLPLWWFPSSLARLQVTSVLCIGFPSAVPSKTPYDPGRLTKTLQVAGLVTLWVSLMCPPSWEGWQG